MTDLFKSESFLLFGPLFLMFIYGCFLDGPGTRIHRRIGLLDQRGQRRFQLLRRVLVLRAFFILFGRVLQGAIIRIRRFSQVDRSARFPEP